MKVTDAIDYISISPYDTLWYRMVPHDTTHVTVNLISESAGKTVAFSDAEWCLRQLQSIDQSHRQITDELIQVDGDCPTQWIEFV